MRSHEPEQIAGRATADEGVVLLDGPNGVAVAMTPECAEGTARQLLAAVEEALRQRAAGEGQ